MESEYTIFDFNKEAKRSETNPRVQIQSALIKRILSSLTKPSYTLSVGAKRVPFENRDRLYRLLRILMRRHSWKEASGVLSVLLKATCKERCPMKNRIKYSAALELLKHVERDGINPNKVMRVFELWMKKIGSMKNWPPKDKFAVQLEYLIFSLGQGNLDEAHQAAIVLLQEREFAGEPISNLIVGLTFYQLWLSTVPEEMKVAEKDASDSPSQLETSRMRFDDSVENSWGHSALDVSRADSPTPCNSETSVMFDKKVSVGDDIEVPDKVSKKVGFNSQRRQLLYQFQHQDLYMNSGESSGHEDGSKLSHGIIHDGFITSAHGLGSWLLPLRLPNENTEDIYSPSNLINDHYKAAVRHLRVALYSRPPVLEALLPLIQLLLLGDQVREALKELEKFCCNSDTTLPFRMWASLLEQFDRNNYVTLSSCYENILKRDPTCADSLSKLVNMHRNGGCSPEVLAEAIAVHLDATFADSNTWRELATCFLELSQNEEDRVSVCLKMDEGECNQRFSRSFNRIPKIFQVGRSGKNWKLRCRWWLRRHFSENLLSSEIATGDLEPLTYKAACASHMYGPDFTYVLKVCAYLKNNDDRNMLSVLQTHMQRAVGIDCDFGSETS